MEKYLYDDLVELESSHWWHLAKRKLVIACIKKYNKVKNPKILDIGCGTGGNLKAFSKLGHAWGIDSERKAVTFCKKRGLKNVKIAKSENIPFKNKAFDIITILDVLEHTDDNKTLAEIKRVLRKDGLLIITVPAFKWLWSQWDVVLHHKRRYSKKSLAALITKNKFRILKSSYLFSFLVVPVYLTRLIKSGINKNYTSDFRLTNNVLNVVLLFISSLEKKILDKFSIPFGTSVFCVAKKS